MLNITIANGTLTVAKDGSPDVVLDTINLTPTTNVTIIKRSGMAVQPAVMTAYGPTYVQPPARPQWVVLVNNDNMSRPLVIPMGKTDQVTWVNTQAGAEIAQAAIVAAIP